MATPVDEWRELVASFVVAVDAGPTSVRLALVDSERALVTAATLGQREKQCCPFFEVSIDIGPAQRALVLTVPDGADAVDALATFVAMLTS